MASLLSDLRRRIRDTRPSHRVLGIAVSGDVDRAVAEVTDGHLIVTVLGAGANSVNLDLSSVQYDTIGKLFQQLHRLPGYVCHIDEDADLEHNSLDIEPIGPTDIGPNSSAVDLCVHLFSDTELETFLRDATQRHNPSFSWTEVPDTEVSFVLTLAHAEVCRRQAYDVSKRRGLDQDVDALLSIARDMESAYESDTHRLRRALASPKEATPNTMAQGDVVLGTIFKRSLRTGFNSPMGANLPPIEPVLLPPSVRDEEDENVRIMWERNRDVDFYSLELWMDTTSEVVRSREGLIFTSTPYTIRESQLDRHSRGVERVTSSKLVFRSFGANSNFDTVAFATFVEEWGQLITSFIVGELEPDRTYYFRLYVVDLNYETSASNVMKYRTRPMRTRFRSDGNPILSPLFGPAGTVVRAYFDSVKGALSANHTFLLDGEPIPFTIVSPYVGEFTVPSFVQTRDKKDVLVRSPTGLFDVRKEAFQVTT